MYLGIGPNLYYSLGVELCLSGTYLGIGPSLYYMCLGIRQCLYSIYLGMGPIPHCVFGRLTKPTLYIWALDQAYIVCILVKDQIHQTCFWFESKLNILSWTNVEYKLPFIITIFTKGLWTVVHNQAVSDLIDWCLLLLLWGWGWNNENNNWCWIFVIRGKCVWWWWWKGGGALFFHFSIKGLFQWNRTIGTLK